MSSRPSAPPTATPSVPPAGRQRSGRGRTGAPRTGGQRLTKLTLVCVIGLAPTALLLSGCVTTKPTPAPSATTQSPTTTPTSTPTSGPTATPTPTATATPTPTATTTAPDEGNSLESAFLQGAHAACGDLASLVNNQQLSDSTGRVIDTANCNSLVKQVKVNTSGLTTTAAAYKAGYNASLDLLFAHAPLCDPQNNCVNKSDLSG